MLLYFYCDLFFALCSVAVLFLHLLFPASILCHCGCGNQILGAEKKKIHDGALRGEDNGLPARTFMLDVTMTHDRYGRTTQHTNGARTHRIPSNGAPHPDGALKNSAIENTTLQLYADKPDPIIFMPVAVNTSGCVYDVFVCLLSLHAHREASALAGELPLPIDLSTRILMCIYYSYYYYAYCYYTYY